MKTYLITNFVCTNNIDPATDGSHKILELLIFSSSIILGPVLLNDLQTPLKKSRFDFLVQIVEKRSETNEKQEKKNYDFFSFDCYRFCSQFSSVFEIFLVKKNKRCAMS